MKIPIYEEILFEELSAEKLRIIVSDSRIGKVPCYLNLSTIKTDEIDNIIMNLEQIILENNLHPFFPYPLYIISTIHIDTIFPIVKSVKELPEHYFKKIKRPSNKELQLLNKLALKVNKIKNLEIYKILGIFKLTCLMQRNLYNETKELYFLETLSSKIFEKIKTIKKIDNK